jgi:NAD+ diphosphatase
MTFTPFTPFTALPAQLTPTVRYFVCGPRGVLVRADAQAEPIPSAAALGALGAFAGPLLYVGRLGDEDCVAVPATEADAPAEGLVYRPLRALLGLLSPAMLPVAMRAVPVADWEVTHRFCGRCGTPTDRSATERSRKCPRCELSSYPRISPAVIVLVRRGEQALLARNGRFPMAFFSTLAGFVEPGESLEQCVAREIQEEVGVAVKDLRYFGSQPWPFPHSLMIGFTAQYAGGELTPDGEEIVEAGWYTRDAHPPVPPPFSIARQLIDAWINEGK